MTVGNWVYFTDRDRMITNRLFKETEEGECFAEFSGNLTKFNDIRGDIRHNIVSSQF